MGKKAFRLPDHEVAARLARLRPDQAAALDEALELLSGKATAAATAAAEEGEGNGLPFFLLPLAEFGLASAQLVRLAEKIPPGFPLDHRQIYFDFRLDRWIRHIEPPTIAESLEEYLESAGTPEDGIAYLKGQWQAFLRKHGSD